MTKIGKDTASLHSDWVELLVGVGLMGLIPFVAALAGTWWYLVKSVGDKSLTPAHRQMILEAVGVLAVITIHSIFNDELTWHAPLLFMVTLGCAELLRRRQKSTIKIGIPRLSSRQNLSEAASTAATNRDRRCLTDSVTILTHVLEPSALRSPWSLSDDDSINLTVTDNAPKSPQKVKLQGTGQ